ncbi:hypothetical protein PhCBS80983_g02220 [Powellomyces hirtus]|uniref:FZ domain-containing protein n=1 Tax=Powellomyces hirtus TaxID=109895 RepID=A0A507E8R4_9FUNG|nr:hypothetical protein PhCBS80983_g02220 [Powellomyces hirtus]
MLPPTPPSSLKGRLLRLLVLSVAASAVVAQGCTPVTLSTKACGIVLDGNMPTLVSPENSTRIEAVLDTMFNKLNALQTVAPTCYGYLRQLYCASAFPGCMDGTPVLPCATACQFVVDACTPTLTALAQEQLLPDCALGVSIGASRIPFPTTQCMGSDAPGAIVRRMAAQSQTIGVANPADVYNEGGLSTAVIIILCLYVLSFFGFLDLIIAFSRLRRSYSVVSWAVLWLVMMGVYLVGLIMFQWDIRRAFGSDWCRIQALVLTYLNQSSWIWPFFFTADVWYAVVRKKMRATSESQRFLWNAPFAFLLPIIPTVVLAIKANPVGLSPPANLQPGYAPHVIFCTFSYPVIGWAMSTLPFVAFFATLSIGFGSHAAYHLYKQRRAFNSSNSSGMLSDPSRSSPGNSGTRAQQRAQSRISIVLFARILSVTVIYLFIAVAANYQQVRAVVNGAYVPGDKEPGFRDYAAASIGIVVWFVLCTSSATWSRTIAGTLQNAAFGGKAKNSNLEISTSSHHKSKRSGLEDDDMIELRAPGSLKRTITSSTKASEISGPYNVATTHTMPQPHQATFTRHDPQSTNPVPPVTGDTWRREPGVQRSNTNTRLPFLEHSHPRQLEREFDQALVDPYNTIERFDAAQPAWPYRKNSARSEAGRETPSGYWDDGFEGAALPRRETTQRSYQDPTGPRRTRSQSRSRSASVNSREQHHRPPRFNDQQAPPVPPLSINTIAQARAVSPITTHGYRYTQYAPSPEPSSAGGGGGGTQSAYHHDDDDNVHDAVIERQRSARRYEEDPEALRFQSYDTHADYPIRSVAVDHVSDRVAQGKAWDHE